MDFIINFVECYSVIDIVDKSSKWIAYDPLFNEEKFKGKLRWTNNNEILLL